MSEKQEIPTNPDLRDWFAGQALEGLSATEEGIVEGVAKALMGGRPEGIETLSLEWFKWWAEAEARWCYMKADAMLKARSA